MTISEAQAIIDMYSLCDEFDPFMNFLVPEDELPDYYKLWKEAVVIVNASEIANTKSPVEHRCKCRKCNGKGKIHCYSHIDGGICYRCNGTGFE